METMAVEQVQQVLVLVEFVFYNIIFNGVKIVMIHLHKQLAPPPVRPSQIG